jgi:hypothetical protein
MVGFALLAITMLGGLPQGVALYFSARRRLRQSGRLAAAWVVQRGGDGLSAPRHRGHGSLNGDDFQ